MLHLLPPGCAIVLPRGGLCLQYPVPGYVIRAEGALLCALGGVCAAVWVGWVVQLLLRAHNAAPSVAVG